MKNYFLQTLILFLHLIITVAAIGLCILNFSESNNFSSNPVLFFYGIIEAVLFLFIILYYSKLIENLNQSSPFLSLFFVVFQIAVFLFIYYYSDISLHLHFGTLQTERNILECSFFMNLMLSGYGILSHNKSKTTVNSFILGSVITAIAFSAYLPKIQGNVNFVENFWVILVFSLSTVINLFIFLVLLFSDPIGSQSVRHLVGIVITIITWGFFTFQTASAVLITLNALIVVLLLVFVICKYNSIKL